jgi:coiled-coil domain-containing protein 115
LAPCDFFTNGYSIITEDNSNITLSISSVLSSNVQAATSSVLETEQDLSETPKLPSENANEDSESEADTTHDKPTHQDPLRWFGILTPSGLRAAQTSFISAVEGPVPRLVTLSKQLRSLEVDIGRLRKQIRKL